MSGHGAWSGQRERDSRVDDSVSENAYGKPISADTAQASANPHYAESVRNYDGKYTENCNRCWIAYEEQRRGLECEARPTFNGDTWGMPSECMEKAYEGAKWIDCTAVDTFGGTKRINMADTAKLMHTIMTEGGDGSRFGVATSWAHGGGHIFNAEVMRDSSGNGLMVKLVDAQTNHSGTIRKVGDTYEIDGIAANYIENLAARNSSITGARGIEVARIDNLRLSNTGRRTALRTRGGKY